MPPRGTYQTRQQEAVAELFAQRPDTCLTAEEAHRLLNEAGMDIGKTTVYRVIARLCDAGRLRRYALNGGAASYQHNPCAHSHLHIRCTCCGALDHLCCDEAESFARHLSASHGFTLDEGQTILYGCCEACRNKQTK